MADGTIVFNQTLLDQQVRNVTVWSNMPSDPVDMQALADALRGGWSTQFASFNALGWSLDSLTFSFNETAPIFSVTVPFSLGPLVGADSSDPLPTQTSLLVSTRYVGPPPNRGRVYLAGTTEVRTTNGRYSSGILAAATALVQSWIDGVDYGNGIAFLRIARRNPDGTLLITSPAEIALAQDIPATQRSRRIGVGA